MCNSVDNPEVHRVCNSGDNPEVYPGVPVVYTSLIPRFTVGQFSLLLPVSLLGIPLSLVQPCSLWRVYASFLPVSLLVGTSCSLCYSRFTVGRHPPLSTPVSLLGNTLGPEPGMPHILDIPDIPARTNELSIIFPECENPRVYRG